MNLTAFSLLANSSLELDGSQEIELTIGSLSIFVGPSGSSRLSDSTKPDPSASKPEIEEILESSEGSSSEVNSSVSPEKAPIAEGDKIGKILTQKKEHVKRATSKGTSPLEARASPRYISYASLSQRQKKKIAVEEVKRSTGKSTKQKKTTKRRRSTSQLANGE
jgi:hypothetical protein